MAAADGAAAVRCDLGHQQELYQGQSLPGRPPGAARDQGAAARAQRAAAARRRRIAADLPATVQGGSLGRRRPVAGAGNRSSRSVGVHVDRPEGLAEARACRRRCGFDAGRRFAASRIGATGGIHCARATGNRYRTGRGADRRAQSLHRGSGPGPAVARGRERTGDRRVGLAASRSVDGDRFAVGRRRCPRPLAAAGSGVRSPRCRSCVRRCREPRRRDEPHPIHPGGDRRQGYELDRQDHDGRDRAAVRLYLPRSVDTRRTAKPVHPPAGSDPEDGAARSQFFLRPQAPGPAAARSSRGRGDRRHGRRRVPRRIRADGGRRDRRGLPGLPGRRRRVRRCRSKSAGVRRCRAAKRGRRARHRCRRCARGRRGRCRPLGGARADPGQALGCRRAVRRALVQRNRLGRLPDQRACGTGHPRR